MTIYGVRARETPEDLNEREIRRHIRSLLPELFGGTCVVAWLRVYGSRTSGEPTADCAFPADFNAHAEDLVNASRFEQVRVVYQWLLPILKKSINRQVRVAT